VCTTETRAEHEPARKTAAQRGVTKKNQAQNTQVSIDDDKRHNDNRQQQQQI
jgi:hypothetical protein